VTDPIPLSSVGRTALAVALARAIESERDDAWFYDPLASWLETQVASRRAAAGAEPPSINEGLRRWVSVRTRFLDEVALSAVDDGIRQIAIVGAGLDARAFRLGLASEVAVFEFDRPDVLAVKQSVVDGIGLAPSATRTVVTGDIMDADWLGALADSGWSPARPTLWILEGFLIYFDDAERIRILSELAGASAVGSRLGATVSRSIELRRHPLWQPFDDDDFVAWFARAGWDATVADLPETSARYGRDMGSLRPEDFPGVLVDARLASAR
jgi:methyltransferase (TIGR00027 family)